MAIYGQRVAPAIYTSWGFPSIYLVTAAFIPQLKHDKFKSKQPPTHSEDIYIYIRIFCKLYF